MKSLRTLALGAALLAGAGMSGSAAFAEDNMVYEKPVTPAAQPAPRAEQPDSALVAIRQAPDPSSAIQAYAAARSSGVDPIAAEDAYVHRLVELGLPEMADAQARDLVQRDPNNAVAWAVTAYMGAKRNEAANALRDITLAVKLAPTDPFVLRTAGQLMAWYDLRVDHASIAPELKQSVDAMRKQLGTQSAYADAYRRAASDLRDSQLRQQWDNTTPNSQQSQQVPPSAQVPSDYSYPAPAAYADTGPIYTDPWAAGVYYPAAEPWYPTTVFYDAWWWPSFGSAFFFDFDHGRHFRHFDRDDFFHHRDFDHRDFGRFDHRRFRDFASHRSFVNRDLVRDRRVDTDNGTFRSVNRNTALGNDSRRREVLRDRRIVDNGNIYRSINRNTSIHRPEEDSILNRREATRARRVVQDGNVYRSVNRYTSVRGNDGARSYNVQRHRSISPAMSGGARPMHAPAHGGGHGRR